jgi:hypothetical protein
MEQRVKRETEWYTEYAKYAHVHMYVNCWNMNTYESMAMWDRYARDNKGIAVISSPLRMMESFKGEAKTINMSVVKYVDFYDTWLALGNPVLPQGPPSFVPEEIPLVKRESYEHEQEFRAIIEEEDDAKTQESGKYIKIPLETLITEIRVSPGAEDWFKNAVEGVIHKYCPGIHVRRSSLDIDPLR